MIAWHDDSKNLISPPLTKIFLSLKYEDVDAACAHIIIANDTMAEGNFHQATAMTTSISDPTYVAYRYNLLRRARQTDGQPQGQSGKNRTPWHCQYDSDLVTFSASRKEVSGDQDRLYGLCAYVHKAQCRGAVEVRPPFGGRSFVTNFSCT